MLSSAILPPPVVQVIVQALTRGFPPGATAAACAALRSLTSSKEHPVPAAYHHSEAPPLLSPSDASVTRPPPPHPAVLDVVLQVLVQSWQHWQAAPDAQAAAAVKSALGVLRNLARLPSNIPALQAHARQLAPVLHLVVRSAAEPPAAASGMLADASHSAAAIIRVAQL